MWLLRDDRQAEEDAVVQARAGSATAFGALYRLHVGRVYALCLRMSRDPDLALDLVQEVFVRAWTRIGSFKGESRFGTWLHRLAANVVIGDLRKRKRETEALDGATMSRFVRESQRSMPSTDIDLERAIASLPDGARVTVILYDIEGYAYREIAELLNVSEGTVKSQINRGRRLLREAMTK